MKANYKQIQLIKIAQKQLGIDNDTKLEQYGFYGVTTSKDLTPEQADDLIASYERAGFVVYTQPKTDAELKNIEMYGVGRDKYKMLDSRSKDFARSSKLRKIEALWREASETKTDDSLRIFIQNKTGVSHITMLFNDQADSIITALEVMRDRKRERSKIKMRAAR